MTFVKELHTPEYKHVLIDRVWAGHPVRFAIVRRGHVFFLAYYDAARRMRAAIYDERNGTLDTCELPEELGWDSHNSISVAIDREGFLHLSGNMHKAPLVYYRSERPLDTRSFVREPAMTGADENSCTYPAFLHDAEGTLFFHYRNGMSGNGNGFINRYDEGARRWSRALDQAVFDGEGVRNAYPAGFRLGPDGWFHVAWVWRDTPACETNHTLCYAKTCDFREWRSADGRILETPFRVHGGDVVDPIRTGEGLMNGCEKLGFDLAGQLVIAYHKFDASGRTQVYNARFENGRWASHETSHWNYRWEFSGRGTVPREIVVFPVTSRDGVLFQHFRHYVEGEGFWCLAQEDLSILETPPMPAAYLDMLRTAPGRMLMTTDDVGAPFFLRWETLPANRDHARQDVMEESELTLCIRR